MWQNVFLALSDHSSRGAAFHKCLGLASRYEVEVSTDRMSQAGGGSREGDCLFRILSHFHRFLRKFRSQETLMPFPVAVTMASAPANENSIFPGSAWEKRRNPSGANLPMISPKQTNFPIITVLKLWF